MKKRRRGGEKEEEKKKKKREKNGLERTTATTDIFNFITSSLVYLI